MHISFTHNEEAGIHLIDQYPPLYCVVQWPTLHFFFFRTLSIFPLYTYTVTFFFFHLSFVTFSHVLDYVLLCHWFLIHLYFKMDFIDLCFRWSVPPFLSFYLCEFVLFMVLLYHANFICQHIF